MAISLSSAPALAAPLAERVQRALDAGQADKATALCQRGPPEDLQVAGALRNACAQAALQQLLAGPSARSVSALLHLSEDWAGTPASESARERAGAQLLDQAGQDIGRLGSTYALLPGSTAAQEALRRALQRAQEEPGPDLLLAFAEAFPDTPQAAQARGQAAERGLEEARRLDTIQAWSSFLASWPEHEGAVEATERLVVLELEWARQEGPRALHEFATRHVEHPLADEARWLALESELALVVYDGQGQELTRLAAEEPPAVLPAAARSVVVQAPVDASLSVVVVEAGASTRPLGSLAQALQQAGLERSLVPEHSEPSWEEGEDARTLSLPAALCLPPSAQALAIEVQLGARSTRVPFQPVRTCAEVAAWTHPSATVQLDGQQVELGWSPARFSRAFPTWRLPPHTGRYERLCHGQGPNGSEACVTFLAGRLAWIDVSCALDPCYMRDSTYNRLRPGLVQPLGKGRTSKADSSTHVTAWIRDGVLAIDRQYVGAESGDPGFQLTVSTEGVERYRRLLQEDHGKELALAPERPTLHVWVTSAAGRSAPPPPRPDPSWLAAVAALGFDVEVQTLSGDEFPAAFRAASEQGHPPEIVASSNHLPLEEIGARDPTAFLRVAGSLGHYGPFAYVVQGAPRASTARHLASRSPSCESQQATSVPEGLGSDQARSAARQWLEEVASEEGPVTVSSSELCAAVSGGTLAATVMALGFELPGQLGWIEALELWQRTDQGWELVGGSTYETKQTLEELRTLLGRIRDEPPPSGSGPPPASDLSPADGSLPQAPAGERFGTFRWEPSPSPDLVGELAIFRSGPQVRVFVRRAAAGDDEPPSVSTGKLITRHQPWTWRVLSIDRWGRSTWSEERRFVH